MAELSSYAESTCQWTIVTPTEVESRIEQSPLSSVEPWISLPGNAENMLSSPLNLKTSHLRADQNVIKEASTENRGPRRSTDNVGWSSVDAESDYVVLRDGSDSPGSVSEAERDLTMPIYPKGIFKMSTTSTQPLPRLRQNIELALKTHRLPYVLVAGGYRCGRRSPLELVPSTLVFEILIIKIPFIYLHGLRFRRVSGAFEVFDGMVKQILSSLGKLRYSV